MTGARRILIIKSSSMGDIIHALPVAHDIRRALPDARIDWVAEESFRDIPLLAPAVEAVRVTAFRRWRKSLLSAGTRAEIASLKRELAAEHYDCVLDIQGLMRSALVARWTGVPPTGYTWGTIREPHFGLLAKGEPSVKTDAKTVSFAVNTSRDEKLWPDDSWMELGRRFVAEGLTPVIYWGGAKEEARAKRVAAGIPGAVVAPRARLSQVAVSLAQAELMVGVDTGLAHLAAALGCPSVGIFVATPTETLRLIGDGPCESLGGTNQMPTVDEVFEASRRVRAQK